MGIKYRHRGELFSGIKYAFKGMELNAVVRQEIVKGKQVKVLYNPSCCKHFERLLHISPLLKIMGRRNK